MPETTMTTILTEGEWHGGDVLHKLQFSITFNTTSCTLTL